MIKTLVLLIQMVFFNELKNNIGNNHYNSFDIRDMVNDKDYLNKSNIKKDFL